LPSDISGRAPIEEPDVLVGVKPRLSAAIRDPDLHRGQLELLSKRRSFKSLGGAATEVKLLCQY
jgi:hypothetical protein